MADTLILRGGRLLDPACGQDMQADILLEDGVIRAVGQNLNASRAHVLDASGCLVAPGLVDMHVHLRDPGFTYKEDLKSGTLAAAAGGVTTVAAMPNTSPVTDSPEVLADICKRAEDCPARVVPVAAITLGQEGRALTDFPVLKAAGAVALSDDGKPVATAKLMREALMQARNLQMPVLAHCEEPALSGNGIINEGEVSRKLAVPGIPGAAEDVGTAREIALAAATGCPVHICHVSTAVSVAMIRAAKRDGVRVTAETCPHYFTLTQQALLSRDADYRMNPPLRTQEDRKAILQGLCDGTIDAIATDHAPHAKEEKADFLSAPNGIVGLETSLAVSYTVLVKGGWMQPLTLFQRMSARPAQILGVPGGTLKVGANADVVVFAPEETWTVTPETLHGKASNTAFKGMQLQGRVKYTICRGSLVYEKQ